MDTLPVQQKCDLCDRMVPSGIMNWIEHYEMHHTKKITLGTWEEFKRDYRKVLPQHTHKIMREIIKILDQK